MSTHCLQNWYGEITVHHNCSGLVSDNDYHYQNKLRICNGISVLLEVKMNFSSALDGRGLITDLKKLSEL